jgi:hypothetical protein
MVIAGALSAPFPIGQQPRNGSRWPMGRARLLPCQKLWLIVALQPLRTPKNFVILSAASSRLKNFVILSAAKDLLFDFPIFRLVTHASDAHHCVFVHLLANSGAPFWGRGWFGVLASHPRCLFARIPVLPPPQGRPHQTTGADNPAISRTMCPAPRLGP